MINTTIRVVSSDGVRSSEEVIITQSAGAVGIDEDRQNHINSISLDNIQHAVEVTIDNILDAIEDEENRRKAIRDRLDGLEVDLPGIAEDGDDPDVH